MHRDSDHAPDDLSDVIIPEHPCPPARCSLAEWEAEAETLPHLRLLIRERRNRQARDAWSERTERWGGRDVVLSLARDHGYSLSDIATVVGAKVAEVAATLVRPGENVDKLLAVIETWRARPDWPARKIARACDVNVAFVIHHIEQLGGTLVTVERTRAGGGHKHPPEVYETIRRLREDEGKSYTQIAKLVGLHWASVAKMCERRGFTKGGGTVAVAS